MQVRRFVAPTMRDAIDQVRTEFGPEAVILHTRKYRPRGLVNLFRPPQYEVVAAVESAYEIEEGRTPGERERRSGSHTASSRSSPSQVPVRTAPVRPATADRDESVVTAAMEDAVGLVIRRLQEQEVADEWIEDLVEFVCGRARNVDLLNDVEWVWTQVRELMERLVPCADAGEIGRARIVPLIGPTGVGKTTTLAKLAANFALLAHRDVAIITADTYRVAAVDQLRTYASLIDVPLSVVYTPEEMRAAVAEHAGADMILIDTAGRSQHHTTQMDELRAFLAELPDPQTHLVVSATTKMQDLVDIIERFRPLNFDRLIVTKVDETRVYGTIFNLARLAKRPLTYFTTGQNVPDDIEVAVAKRLVDWILPMERGRQPHRD